MSLLCDTSLMIDFNTGMQCPNMDIITNPSKVEAIKYFKVVARFLQLYS